MLRFILDPDQGPNTLSFESLPRVVDGVGANSSVA